MSETISLNEEAIKIHLESEQNYSNFEASPNDLPTLENKLQSSEQQKTTTISDEQKSINDTIALVLSPYEANPKYTEPPSDETQIDSMLNPDTKEIFQDGINISQKILQARGITEYEKHIRQNEQLMEQGIIRLSEEPKGDLEKDKGQFTVTENIQFDAFRIWDPITYKITYKTYQSEIPIPTEVSNDDLDIPEQYSHESEVDFNPSFFPEQEPEIKPVIELQLDDIIIQELAVASRNDTASNTELDFVHLFQYQPEVRAENSVSREDEKTSAEYLQERKRIITLGVEHTAPQTHTTDTVKKKASSLSPAIENTKLFPQEKLSLQFQSGQPKEREHLPQQPDTARHTESESYSIDFGITLLINKTPATKLTARPTDSSTPDHSLASEVNQTRDNEHRMQPHEEKNNLQVPPELFRDQYKKPDQGTVIVQSADKTQAGPARESAPRAEVQKQAVTIPIKIEPTINQNRAVISARQEQPASTTFLYKNEGGVSRPAARQMESKQTGSISLPITENNSRLTQEPTHKTINLPPTQSGKIKHILPFAATLVRRVPNRKDAVQNNSTGGVKNIFGYIPTPNSRVSTITRGPAKQIIEQAALRSLTHKALTEVKTPIIIPEVQRGQLPVIAKPDIVSDQHQLENTIAHAWQDKKMGKIEKQANNLHPVLPHKPTFTAVATERVAQKVATPLVAKKIHALIALRKDRIGPVKPTTAGTELIRRSSTIAQSDQDEVNSAQQNQTIRQLAA